MESEVEHRKLKIQCSPVLFLTSGVKNVKKGDLIINYTLLSVRVWFQAERRNQVTHNEAGRTPAHLQW